MRNQPGAGGTMVMGGHHHHHNSSSSSHHRNVGNGGGPATISVSTSRSSQDKNNKGNGAEYLQQQPRLLTPKTPTRYPKIEDTMRQMNIHLGRFTRANDRRMVLRTLKEVKYMNFLQIKARPSPAVNLEEYEQEISQESIILNGHSFKKKSKHGRKSTDFLTVVHELCRRLCEGLPNSPDTLYYDILSRLARSVTSADAFKALENVLQCPELILMNAGSERKSKPTATYNNNKNGATKMVGEPLTELTLFESDGYIHAHVVTYMNFGLYRKADINTGRPWIKMQAVLRERSNFTNGEHVRLVSVNWPDMYV